MGFGAFAVRGQGSDAALIAAIRRALREVDPQVPVVDIQTMDGRVQEGLRRERLLAMLGTLFRRAGAAARRDRALRVAGGCGDASHPRDRHPPGAGW